MGALFVLVGKGMYLCQCIFVSEGEVALVSCDGNVSLVCVHFQHVGYFRVGCIEEGVYDSLAASEGQELLAHSLEDSRLVADSGRGRKKREVSFQQT